MEPVLAVVAVAAIAALVVVLVRSSSSAPDPLLHGELHELRAAIEAVGRDQGSKTGELRGMLTEISQAQASALAETGKLSQALRRPGVRGRWGELTLRNVIESAGLVNHVDFDTQRHMAGDEIDPAVRPDLVIKLPGDGSVPVDAKVPLDCFQDAIDADTELEREAALDRHVQAVRGKVRDLAGKAYWQRFRRAPEVVVMFIASEAAFAAAIERDPTLLSQAGSQRVVIATPATMLALLQAIALTWRERDLSENGKRVQELATELVKRIGVLSGHLSETGRALERAVGAHNSAVGSYEGRLLVTARQLGELGIADAEKLEQPARVNGSVRAGAALAAENRDAPAPAALPAADALVELPPA